MFKRQLRILLLKLCVLHATQVPTILMHALLLPLHKRKSRLSLIIITPTTKAPTSHTLLQMCKIRNTSCLSHIIIHPIFLISLNYLLFACQCNSLYHKRKNGWWLLTPWPNSDLVPYNTRSVHECQFNTELKRNICKLETLVTQPQIQINMMESQIAQMGQQIFMLQGAPNHFPSQTQSSNQLK